MHFASPYFRGHVGAPILFSAVLFILFLAAWVTSATAKEKQEPAMTFVVVKGLRCAETCPEWISAEGRITSGTPAQLRKVLKSIGKRKLPVVLNSPGGDVDAAYAMGRMIRKAGLETTVGATWLDACPPKDKRCRAGIGKGGKSTGYSHPFRAGCYSACPLVLAGGTVRAFSRFTYIGLHQITTIHRKVRVSYEVEYAIVNGRKKEISRREVGRKVQSQKRSTELDRKDSAELAAYLREMGIGAEFIEFMMSAPPDDMRFLRYSESRRIGLVTDLLAQREWPGMSLCAEGDAVGAMCHRRVPEAPVAAPASAPVVASGPSG